MKLEVLENGVIQFENVFNPIILKTKDNEKLSIFMRDSGFEFNYQGKDYYAKNGEIEEFNGFCFTCKGHGWLPSTLIVDDSNICPVCNGTGYNKRLKK